MTERTRPANIYYSEVETPIGSMILARTKHGLCWVSLQGGDNALRALENWSRKSFLTNQMQRDEGALKDISIQLEEYFAQERRSFEVEYDLVGTPFQKLVWNALLSIPYGEVRSYKQVAQAIGSPKAIRAVGGANNKNNIPIFIPCHRVIGSNGSLVGYGSGVHIKQQLLELEGYQVKSII